MDTVLYVTFATSPKISDSMYVRSTYATWPCLQLKCPTWVHVLVCSCAICMFGLEWKYQVSSLYVGRLSV